MYLKQHMIISKYICHYFSYQVTFGCCAPINARENSNWLSDTKQCKRYKEPDLYCTLVLIVLLIRKLTFPHNVTVYKRPISPS